MPPLIQLFLLGKYKEMCFKDTFYLFSLIIIVRTNLWNLIDIFFDNILLYLLCNIFLGKHVSPDIPYFKFHTPWFGYKLKIGTKYCNLIKHVYLFLSLCMYVHYLHIAGIFWLQLWILCGVFCVCACVCVFVLLCFWMRMCVCV